MGRCFSGRICEDSFSIARRAEIPRDATERPCWVEPSTADSSIRPRLAKARPTGPGPAASGVGTWISGSARAVGVARPESPRASSDGISARQRLGEARESANESCRGGFREIRQKPSVFSPDEILASDRSPKTTKSISSLYRAGGARWTLCSSVPPRMAICVCRNVSLNNTAIARHRSRSCSTWRWLGQGTAV